MVVTPPQVSFALAREQTAPLVEDCVTERPTPGEELRPVDPASESEFDSLAACILEELRARVAFGDDPHSPEGQRTLADLIADVVLDSFTIRARGEPRYRRIAGGQSVQAPEAAG